MGGHVMCRTAFQNRQGVTLVEVMIALLIALVIFLALMQTALIGIDANMQNLLRSEAVSVAAEKMDWARNLSFASLGLLPDPYPDVTRRVRNADIVFHTTTTVTELDGDGNFATDDANNKEINILVFWDWKENTVANGNPYKHSITTIRKR